MNKEQIEKLKQLAFEVRQHNEPPRQLYHIYAEYNGFCFFVEENCNELRLGSWASESIRSKTTLISPKPELKKVPLTYEDMLQRVLDRNPMWITSYGYDIGAITEFNEHRIIIGGKAIGYAELMQFSFVDGDTCYKLEGE